MIKLYGAGPSRWVKCYWTLRELDIPFEPVPVSVLKGETRTLDFLAKNPFGKLPLLEDDGFRLRESSAICTYLAEKHPEKGLLPKPGSPERALVNQWMSFAVADLEQPLWRSMKHRFLYPEKMRIPAEVEVAHDDFKALAATLEHQLRGDYAVGDTFTLADVTLAYTLRWSRIERIIGGDLLATFPRLIDYTRLHTSRPAFPKELYS
ncbi:MAG: glutathione S-transferase family protein [Myxococcota bacterium]|nr:glutathione S-transferase family protein [Myxococcota bacterium]